MKRPVETENGIYGGSTWTWNPPASAWYAQHLWEHYAIEVIEPEAFGW